MTDKEMFTITKDWINKHKTPKGSWTKAQTTALGLEWPLTSGWRGRIDGTIITHEQAKLFEVSVSVKSKGRTDREHLNAAIRIIINNIMILTEHDVARLLAALCRGKS